MYLHVQESPTSRGPAAVRDGAGEGGGDEEEEEGGGWDSLVCSLQRRWLHGGQSQ